METTKATFIAVSHAMFTIQFIDSQTGANIEGITTREWPAVARPGDHLILCLSSENRQFKVIKTTWIDPMKETGRIVARLTVEEIA